MGMKKEDFIREKGLPAYEIDLRHKREWARRNPTAIKKASNEHNRAGGKYYEQKLQWLKSAIPNARHTIRVRHGHMYRAFKEIIAPDSELQHEWLPGTAKYRGVALVESKPHQYGIIDVIQILEGKITLFTEKEIREQGTN